MNKGPGTNEQQIAALEAKLNEEDVADANSIRCTYHSDVVALAHKLNRHDAKQNRLPKSVVDLIAKLPPEEAKKVRDRLLQVRK